MVIVAQLVEHQIVALGVVGSSPIYHPKRKMKRLIEKSEAPQAVIG